MSRAWFYNLPLFFLKIMIPSKFRDVLDRVRETSPLLEKIIRHHQLSVVVVVEEINDVVISFAFPVEVHRGKRQRNRGGGSPPVRISGSGGSGSTGSRGSGSSTRHWFIRSM